MNLVLERAALLLGREEKTNERLKVNSMKETEEMT